MKMSVMMFPFHRGLGNGTLAAQELVAAFIAEEVTAFEPSAGWVKGESKTSEAFFKAAADAGMVCSCYDIGVNLIGESDADRAKALDNVEREVAFCRDELDCVVAMVPGTKPASDMSNEDGRKLYAEQLAKVVERTKGTGVTITIEDYGMLPSFTASAAHCLQVLEAANCPDLKFTFDNGNFLYGDDRPTQVFDMFRDRIAHVHVKDLALCGPDDQPRLRSIAGMGYKGCAIGHGEAEVADTVKLLRATGYDGWLSLEVGASSDPVAEAIRGARFVRDAWEEG